MAISFSLSELVALAVESFFYGALRRLSSDPDRRKVWGRTALKKN
jgi:hypothetical protein